MKTDIVTLSDAYFGSLGKYAPFALKDFELNEKSKRLVGLYLELLKEFPDDVIEKKGKLPEKLLEKLKRAGFFGMTIPPEYGGLGMTVKEYLVLVEVLASHSIAVGITIIAHLSIGIKGILLFGSQEQKQKYLPGAASGEIIFSYALTEPAIGSDAQNITTSAQLSDDGSCYVINGAKTYITNAGYAGGMTVFARLESGSLGAFIVETSYDGVKIGKEMPKMGLKASSTAFVKFDDVRVPRENLIGREGEGFKIAMTILNYGRLALGATSSGMINRSLEDMVKRSGGRKQFGVPIKEFELIREMLVRAKVNGKVVSAMTAFSSEILDRNPTANIAVESSHCKLFGTTRAWQTLYDALQVAGGSGYLETLPYEKRMRDFRVTTIFEGTTEIHSIHPGLVLAKKLEDILKEEKSVASKLNLILRSFFPGSGKPSRAGSGALKPAARMVRRLIRKIIIFILLGLIRYGGKLRYKEFYLRRITFLSMYCYGILAMIAKIDTLRSESKPVDGDLEILRFFVHEAKEYSRHHAGWFSGVKDHLTEKVFRTIQFNDGPDSRERNQDKAIKD
jgi:acyl-CoA dehydrogenase family member 9